MNVLDPIARQVAAHPDRAALVDGEGTLTFAQLWGQAQAFAWHLREQKVLAGQTVGVAPMAQRRYVLATLAIGILGATSAPLLAWPEATWREMTKRHRMDAWIGDDDMPLNARYPSDSRRIAMSVLLRPLPRSAELPVLVRGIGPQLWRITLSSGTTGLPRSVGWTHAARAAAQRFMMDIYPAGPRERLLLYADPSIAFAYGHMLMMLASGGTVILPSSLRLGEFAGMSKDLRPTRVLMSTGDAFNVVEHLKRAAAEEGSFDSVLSVLVGGSTVSPALRRDLEQFVCPHVMVTYGCTEAGTLARADSETVLANPNAAGRLVPWIQAQAVDTEGKALPPGETGLLRFRSPAMAQGYLGDADADSPSGFHGGWFYPGDRGSIDARRNLYLQGRVDSLMNLQGRKVDASAIEEALNAQPGVRESAMVLVERPGAQPLAIAAVVGDVGLPLAPLRDLVRKSVGPRSAVVHVASLPKNAAGKVMRPKLAELLAQAVVEKDRVPPKDDA